MSRQYKIPSRIIPNGIVLFARMSTVTRCEPPAPSVGLLVGQVGRSVSRSFRETIAPLGLEPRQYLLLRSIAGTDGGSQQAIAASLQIPPSRMVVLVDALEERGLVLRVANPADRRAYALRLTPAGRRLLVKAQPIADAFETSLCEPFTARERALLVELLGRIAERRRLGLGTVAGR
jgi:DNA-binding MarR family transcriptional regulator